MEASRNPGPLRRRGGSRPRPARPFPSDPLETLLDLLARRAALYEKAALGFSCDETVLVGKFSARSGENKKEDEASYNYLYEGDPGSGFVERRFRADRNAAPEDARIVDPDLPVPGAYDWALLFTGRHRPFFRFESAGDEMVGFHATRVLAFRGGAVWVRGRQIEEWSGKIWVDSESGNFVKIVAAPNQQEDLLPLRADKVAARNPPGRSPAEEAAQGLSLPDLLHRGKIRADVSGRGGDEALRAHDPGGGGDSGACPADVPQLCLLQRPIGTGIPRSGGRAGIQAEALKLRSPGPPGRVTARPPRAIVSARDRLRGILPRETARCKEDLGCRLFSFSSCCWRSSPSPSGGCSAAGG